MLQVRNQFMPDLAYLLLADWELGNVLILVTGMLAVGCFSVVAISYLLHAKIALLFHGEKCSKVKKVDWKGMEFIIDMMLLDTPGSDGMWPSRAQNRTC